ncbi:MAG: S1C family serine protease, partial [Terriglobia bacterium]
TGSGFAVSPTEVLTNNHVIEGCGAVRLKGGFQEINAVAVLLATDAGSDLALLEPAVSGCVFPGIPLVAEKPARFRDGLSVRPGEEIVVIGFPLYGLLSSEPSVTTGTVSALAGPGDDRRFLQITAPVQQGNSGGPLLDLAGNVVGVIVGKLDALLIAGLTGDIPQNVNFAVSASTARAFLDAHDVPYEAALSEPKLTASDVAAKAREYTVLVEC